MAALSVALAATAQVVQAQENPPPVGVSRRWPTGAAVRVALGSLPATPFNVVAHTNNDPQRNPRRCRLFGRRVRRRCDAFLRGRALPRHHPVGAGRIGIANHPCDLSGGGGRRINCDAVGFLEEYRGSGRLPADIRGVLWTSVAGNQLYPPTALRRKTPLNRGLGPCRQRRRVQIQHSAMEWLLPGTMVLLGLTSPMSIPRTAARGTEVASTEHQNGRLPTTPPSPLFVNAHERLAIDRSPAFRLAASERLKAAGWRFDEVIRTWLCLGNITGRKGKRIGIAN